MPKLEHISPVAQSSATVAAVQSVVQLPAEQ